MCHRFPHTKKQCMPTCSSPPHLTFWCRHYHLSQTAVPDGWFQILLVSVEFPLKLSLHYNETTGFIKFFDNKHVLLHAVHHITQYTMFTWLQTPNIPTSSGTTFTFPTSHAIVVHISNCSMFFWLCCNLWQCFLALETEWFLRCIS
jgi:hypothetical protein